MFSKAVKILSAASLAVVLLLGVFSSNVSAQESPLPSSTPTEAPDLCPNIPETQTEVPQGYFINNEGECVLFESPSPNPCDGEFCSPSPSPSESPSPIPDPCVENQNCPSSTPEPTPTSPTCGENEHLDASGQRCTGWSQNGGGDNGGGSSTSGGGSVLGASTVLGATGNTENIIGLMLVAAGISISSVSLYAYSKNKYI